MRSLTSLLLLVLLSSASILRGDDQPSVPAVAPSGEDALFADMPVVEAASLHAQTLAEAPASVTVITAADIRKYGYRTLADVLSAARGFTMISNHLASSSEVRGFAAPGDLNTCFLIMINGHNMTEIFDRSNSLFDQDFGLDLDLVERIEIIRGPSSALYGSNGILATINIVTKAPVDASRYMVTTETGAGEPDKLEVMSSQNLGRGANLLIEGSGYLYGGQNLFLPAFDTPNQNNGIANHVDGESGYHTFANLQWGGWSFTSYFNNNLERAPVLTAGTKFNDQGQFLRVERNFAGAAYTHDYADGGEIRWQIDYDQFRYDNRYDINFGFAVMDDRTDVDGDWIDSQLTYSRELPRIGLLTVGLSAQIELRNQVENLDYSDHQALQFRISHPDRSGAPFVQQEWNVASHWKAYFGARWDASETYGNFVSPRLALVYQPNTQSSYKLVYGRPFRAPSLYEAFYHDGLTSVANPSLQPESADAVEASAERKVGKAGYVLANAFWYSMHSAIESVRLGDGLYQYQNTGLRTSRGIEFEVGAHPAHWLETTASLTLEHAEEDDLHTVLPNEPGRIGKIRGAVPIFRERLYFSSDVQYLSARTTADGTLTRPVALVDATLSSNRLFGGFDLIAGVRNALNWGYGEPATWPLDSSMDQIPAYGRTAFVKLIWRSGEQGR